MNRRFHWTQMHFLIRIIDGKFILEFNQQYVGISSVMASWRPGDKSLLKSLVADTSGPNTIHK